MTITIKPGITINPGINIGRPNELILYLDANNPASYPGSGGTWYDLSGNHYDAIIVNGAAFDTDGINFDYQNNQFAVIPAANMFNGDITAIGWVYVRTVRTWARLFDFGNGSGGVNVLVAVDSNGSGNPAYSTTGADNLYSTTALPLNQWVQLVAVQEGTHGKIYINGQQVGVVDDHSGTTGENMTITTTVRNYNYIGKSNWDSDAYLDGKVASLRIYNRAFVSSEILADYYSTTPLTPITANLQLYLDAGNPNSYPGSGSAWTDTIGNRLFTLVGSPTYSSDNGGYIDFNPGSGQYAQCDSSLATMTTWTVEAWHYYAHGTSGPYPALVTEVYNGGSLNYALGKDAGTGGDGLAIGYYDGNTGSSSGWHQTTAIPLTLNNWYHIVGTFDGTTLKLYVNGQLEQSINAAHTVTSSSAGIRLMSRWDQLDLWGGRLGVVRIYNADITQEGVTNNFSAERGRFGI